MPLTAFPDTLPVRTCGEWVLRTSRRHANPFTDLVVSSTFTSPSGAPFTIEGFHDGDSTWRVRFNPGEPGRWSYRIAAYPADPDLGAEGTVDVTDRPTRGFLVSTPREGWGLQYESGEPVFLLGDTAYNLFGMAHCGADVRPFLARRAAQGFTLLRVRLPVSPFHPPDGYNTWQTCRTWPWGGSEQSPRFDRFNLDYFRTVDTVVQSAEELGIGLELIMEAWGFEFPFNSRQIFVAEWEELWLRYLIARYDAFACVAMWTPMNEYEYYPNGDWHHAPVADRWAMRIGRWIKRTAPHGHIVAIHNGPREPAFVERFAADPAAVDTILFQAWGTTGADDGWLAAGIEDEIGRSLSGWTGSAVLAEYGYERNPGLPLLLPGHEHCDPEHTRRGAWRGAFCALGVIHGFENSWGPFQVLDRDQPGLSYLLHLREFLTRVVPFDRVQPAPELITRGDQEPGHAPLALATPDRVLAAVYLPAGGFVELALAGRPSSDARWFDPRTGEMDAAIPRDSRGGAAGFDAPRRNGVGRPHDWALVLTRASA